MIIVLSHMSTCQGYVDPKFSSDMMLLDSDSTGEGAIPLGTSDWCRSTALEVLRPRMHRMDPTEALRKAHGLRIENATDTAPSMFFLSHSARASKCFIIFLGISKSFWLLCLQKCFYFRP